MFIYRPIVSVILTSFNHEKFIREAIESVLSQTFVDFELIIWDDVSTDDSWKIIQSYTDPRIRAFRNSKNEGPCLGVNKAIFEISRSPYIAIHHSDDVWECTKLQKQVDFLGANPEYGAVFTWLEIINEESSSLGCEWFPKNSPTRWEWLNSIFFMKNPFPHPSVLIRKSLYDNLGGYLEYLAQTPDVEMWSRVLLACPVEFIPEKLTFHRRYKDESNTSGYRPDVAIRTWNEWNVLRENYLQISDFETLVAIFPELRRYENPAGFEVKFLLAMTCLYGTDQINSWQLGLRWLLELFGDEEKADRLLQLYSFSIKELYKLMGEFDIYKLYSHDSYLLELQSGKDWMEGQLKALQLEIAAKDSELIIRDARLKELSRELAKLNCSFPVRVLRKVGFLP